MGMSRGWAGLEHLRVKSGRVGYLLLGLGGEGGITGTQTGCVSLLATGMQREGPASDTLVEVVAGCYEEQERRGGRKARLV